jgi:malonate decarboxylase beta subunit
MQRSGPDPQPVAADGAIPSARRQGAGRAMTSLRGATPTERIAAIADPGSVVILRAAGASPWLARHGIAPHDDDGIALAQATLDGAPVLVAAQDERFLGGSVGARHGDALVALFERAQRERPAAVVLLVASAGVRLHEANPAELALGRALRALLGLRAAGLPVLALAVGDVYGGASVLACATDRIALVSGTRLGLSGPKVLEAARGRAEFAADDAAAVAALYGADARAAAGQFEAIADDAAAARGWLAAARRGVPSLAAAIRTTQDRLAARLAAAGTTLSAPAVPLPRALKPLFAAAAPGDGAGWIFRMNDANVWLTRGFGIGALGPREACALDTALLAQLVDGRAGPGAVLVLVADSAGHEVSRAAETLCISQYLAHHAAVLALLRDQGVAKIGFLSGVGHSAAFFCNALQATTLYALPTARVVAMEPATIARVTGQDPAALAATVEDDPLVGHPVRHFAHWGGITAIVADAAPERLLALAADAAATAAAQR